MHTWENYDKPRQHIKKQEHHFANKVRIIKAMVFSVVTYRCVSCITKKGNAKECSNYRTIALISQARKVMLKILQARLQQYVNCELPDVQAGFRKGRGTRDQTAHVRWIIERAREFQKKHLFLLS